MEFILTDETVADILIFWLESTDGSISYWEDEAVKEALKPMNYSMKTYRDTLVHLGSLSTEHLYELIEKAQEYAKNKFSDNQKRNLINLLNTISESDNAGKIELEKLQKIRKEFGMA